MSTSSSTRKVKVGVVGCGVVATAYYLPYLMRHADLVAVCDIYPARTAAVARGSLALSSSTRTMPRCCAAPT